ncbi:MAG: hypothetical protein Q7T11_06685 [Deltaproteobacteria bacterium]|nr:hypothetical protein [Deltaproteobacteria bacterium]
MKRILFPIQFFIFLTLVTSCGGGGSKTGTGSGLEIAEQMALVEADQASLPALMRAAMRMAVPTVGDYITDEADIYVYDESMEVLDMVNEILCMVDQTRYTEMVNEGNYTALIDTSLCGRNNDRSGDSSNESSSQSQEFEPWTVNSSRANNDSDQIVRFWVSGVGEDEGFGEIRAEITITEGRSDSNPFGLFSIDFVGMCEDGENTCMSGNLSSVENSEGTEFTMFMDGGESMQEATHAILRDDGTGQAYALRTFFMGDMGGEGDSGDREAVKKQGNGGSGGGMETHEINVAYDSGHYFTDFGDKASCKERSPVNNVWEYNLYESTTGDRVSRDSGFGIRYGDDDRGWGYAGYYGVWLPEDLVTVESGLEVTKADDDTPYTVFQGEGRLIRRTKNSLTLSDFIGDTFQLWFSPEKQFSTADELASAIGMMNGWRISATANGDTITLRANETGTFANGITMSKNSSGGLTLSGSTLSGGTGSMESGTAATGTITFGSPAKWDTVVIDNVTYTKVDTVESKSLIVEWDGTNFIYVGEEVCSPDAPCETVDAEEEATLSFGANSWVGLHKQGLGNVDLVVPEDGVIANDMDVPYYSEEFVPPSDALFASGEVTFKCYNNCLESGLTEEQISAGDVYHPDTEDVDSPTLYTFDPEEYVLRLDDEAVAWPEGVGEIQGEYTWGIRSSAMVTTDVSVEEVWNIWQEDISYNWETGPNEWNRYTTILDEDGNAPTFEPPLYCQYQDDEHGMFFLDYQGEGKLFGIPYDEVQSEDEEWSHWVARFTIPDGSELECEGALYYTRAMSVEQTFPEVDASECTDLSGLEPLDAPEVRDISVDMDSAPGVSDAPAVIGGVVQ